MNGGPADGNLLCEIDHSSKPQSLVMNGTHTLESSSQKYSSVKSEKPMFNFAISELCVLCKQLGSGGTMERCAKQSCYIYVHRECLKSKTKGSFYCPDHQALANMRYFSDKENKFPVAADSNGGLQKTGYHIDEEKFGDSLDEENLATDILKNQDLSDSEGLQLFKLKKKSSKENGHSNGTKVNGSAKRNGEASTSLISLPSVQLSKRKPVVKVFNDNQIGHFPYKKKSSLGKQSIVSDTGSKRSGGYRSSKGHKEVSRKKPKQKIGRAHV